MKKMLRELYNLNREQYKILRSQMLPALMLKQRVHFIINKVSRPVGVWQMFYYIDKYGDFINKGKEKHHIIARAIFESMKTKHKLQILEYIDENA